MAPSDGLCVLMGNKWGGGGKGEQQHSPWKRRRGGWWLNASSSTCTGGTATPQAPRQRVHVAFLGEILRSHSTAFGCVALLSLAAAVGTVLYSSIFSRTALHLIGEVFTNNTLRLSELPQEKGHTWPPWCGHSLKRSRSRSRLLTNQSRRARRQGRHRAARPPRPPPPRPPTAARPVAAARSPRACPLPPWRPTPAASDC